MRLEQMEEIYFPKHLYWQAVAHARRKLSGHYLPGEEQAPKAYGLVGGRLFLRAGEVTHLIPLSRNLRDDPRIKPDVDHVLDDWAVPSETPLEGRAWVSDPAEVMKAEREFDEVGSVLFGGYHMHRVPWEQDPLRDTCTDVDRQLARGSGLWVFIVSMVDPEQPRLRAFFEGDNSKEAAVRLGHHPLHTHGSWGS